MSTPIIKSLSLFLHVISSVTCGHYSTGSITQWQNSFFHFFTLHWWFEIILCCFSTGLDLQRNLFFASKRNNWCFMIYEVSLFGFQNCLTHSPPPSFRVISSDIILDFAIALQIPFIIILQSFWNQMFIFFSSWPSWWWGCYLSRTWVLAGNRLWYLRTDFVLVWPFDRKLFFVIEFDIWHPHPGSPISLSR